MELENRALALEKEALVSGEEFDPPAVIEGVAGLVRGRRGVRRLGESLKTFISLLRFCFGYKEFREDRAEAGGGG